MRRLVSWFFDVNRAGWSIVITWIMRRGIAIPPEKDSGHVN